ncbi:MAG TPA: hypothetical protein VI968_03895 [archaeon]|nr:hypothetical protein [archaeon]
MEYRKATVANIDEMTHLLLTEGVNEWNYLPESEVRKHLRGIADGTTQAFLTDDGSIVAFVSYNVGVLWPQYESSGAQHGYLAEAVTHHDYRGHKYRPRPCKDGY